MMTMGMNSSTPSMPLKSTPPIPTEQNPIVKTKTRAVIVVNMDDADRALADQAWKQALHAEEVEYHLRSSNPDDEAPLRDHRANPDYQYRFLEAWESLRAHDKPYDVYARGFCEDSKDIVVESIMELWLLVSQLNIVRRSALGCSEFEDVYKLTERVLVAMSGHWNKGSREKCTRLLNMLYDGVDWQRDEPYAVRMQAVGEEFVVTARVVKRMTSEDSIRVLVCAPSFDEDNEAENIVTWHNVEIIDDGSSYTRPIVPVTSSSDYENSSDAGTHEIMRSDSGFTSGKTSHTLQLRLKSLPRSGFYDWRVVTVSPDGKVMPIRFAGRPVGAFEYHVWDGEGSAQGRIVVQPRLSLVHEVFVDLEGVQLVRVEGGANVVSKRGRFESVEAALDGYKSRGVGMINLVGALDRDNGCSSYMVKETMLPAAELEIAAENFKGGRKKAKQIQEEKADKGEEEEVGQDQSPIDGNASLLSPEVLARMKKSGFQTGKSTLSASNASLLGSISTDVSSSAFGIGMVDAGSSVTPRSDYEPRRPDVSPIAVTDRAVPNVMLGGPKGFTSLVKSASERGLKTCATLLPFVSRARHARKYDDVVCNIVDTDGNRVPHSGSDAKENQWEDTVLLNYRKLRAWDLLVDDALTLVGTYGLGGLHLGEAQSWPAIMAHDMDELSRVESNGEDAYDPIDILEGDIVLPNVEHGFWAPASVTSLTSYANPLIVKLVRAVWKQYPQTAFIGDSAFDRCRVLAYSGVVPRSIKLPAALANVNRKVLMKSGVVQSMSELAPGVKALYQYLDYISNLPAGVNNMQLLSCCSPSIPYPSMLFGRGAWTMVDLVCFLPGVALTFIGEEIGRSHRVDMANTYSHNVEWEAMELRRQATRRRHGERNRIMTPSSARSLVSTPSYKPRRSVYSDRFDAPPPPPSSVGGLLQPATAGDPNIGGTYSNGASGIDDNFDAATTVTNLTNGLQRLNVNRLRSSLTRNMATDRDQHDANHYSGSGVLGDGINSGVDENEANQFFFKETALDSVSQEPEHTSTEKSFHMSSVRSWASLASASQTWGDSQRNRAGHSKSQLGPAQTLMEEMPIIRVQSMDNAGTLHDPKQLDYLEAEHKRNIGPQFGFDLGKIADHYAHRHKLHQQYEVLQFGELLPLFAHHRHGVHDNVFAFARWLPHEVPPGHVTGMQCAREAMVIAINFNSHESMFTVDKSGLRTIMGGGHDAGNGSMAVMMSGQQGEILGLEQLGGVDDDLSRPAVVYKMHDILGPHVSEEDLELFSPVEASSTSNLMTLAPHQALAWHFVCQPLSSDATAVAPVNKAAGMSRITSTSKFARHDEISDLERRYFRSTLRRLHQLLKSHEDALSRQQATLSCISGSEGALPDQRLAEAGADNHVFASLKRAFAQSRHRLRRIAQDRVAAEFAASEEGLNLANSGVNASGDLIDLDVPSPVVVDSVATTYTRLVEEIVIEHSTIPLVDLARVAEPLARAFHVLVMQLLPRAPQDTDTDKELKTTKHDEYLGVPIASSPMNMADMTDVVVRALAPLVRKVLFSTTRLMVQQDKQEQGEKTLVALMTVIVKLSSAESTSGPLDGSPGKRSSGNGKVSTPKSKSKPITAGSGADVLGSPLASALASALLASNDLGEMVFIAPELGKWTTVGGLGVMVDELTVGLAALGVKVTVISPFYDKNKKGTKDYLRGDGIHWKRNIRTAVGGDMVDIGLHEGFVNGVRLVFLHNATYFPYPYPTTTSWQTLRVMILMAKGSLEALCQLRLIPSMIVTNDWFTGLVAAFAKSGAYGEPSVFANTFFFHLIHNLDPSYEGRLYINVLEQAAINRMHELPPDLLKDPYWAPVNQQVLFNPSRAALLCSDTWGTVSPSYRDDLLQSSPLATLLSKAPHPFAYVNGIPTVARRQRLEDLGADCNTHDTAKALLQKRYFGFEHADLSIPMLAFVGRITLQKGVHLILSVAASMIQQCGGRIQFMVCGPANAAEKYSADCVSQMRALRHAYPSSFWADPDLFFTDGPLVNLGTDFGLMPSLFEPSGIVQQEFFVAGTPVVAFRTGGLKDTVFEFNHNTRQGNGFTFQAHNHGDFMYALQRALDTFRVPELTNKLRENAEASVLDLASVSFAWYKEFMRCRKCMVGVAPMLVRFPVPAGGKSMPKDVKVRGDFTDDQDLELTLDPCSGEMTRLFKLPDGQYTFVFVVEGQVTLAPGVPLLRRDDGTKKHVVLVDSQV